MELYVLYEYLATAYTSWFAIRFATGFTCGGYTLLPPLVHPEGRMTANINPFAPATTWQNLHGLVLGRPQSCTHVCTWSKF